MLSLFLACSSAPSPLPDATAPIPYSEAQIRDSFVMGLEIDWEVQEKAQRWRVVGHDEQGVALWSTGPKHPTIKRSTWTEIRSHAMFPAASTTIEFVVLDTPFGKQPANLYTVLGNKRFWFGTKTPGPPLQHILEGPGRFEMRMTRREVVELASEVRAVDVDGVELWTRSEGRGGPPMLMVHGGPGMTSFPFERGVGPMLAASRQVIYADYRGAGRSARPAGPENYSFAILGEDLSRIRAAYGAEQVIVLGHSNGAATALTYARTHPQDVAALILVGPLLSPADLEANVVNKALMYGVDERAAAVAILAQGGPIEERFVAMLESLPAGDRHALQFASPEGQARFDKIMADLKHETGLTSNSTPDLIQGLRRAGFFAFDAFSFVDDLTMPVLVLVGAEDPEISHENARRFTLAVGGTYVELPGSGHHPFVEQPEAMATAIEAFLYELN